MIPGMKPRSDSEISNSLHVFEVQEDNQDDDVHQIGTLVDAWLMPQYQPSPDFEAARVVERTLHAAIKRSTLYGLVLSFAGLNIWVNARTPDGIVESQEAINL
jgi:hypothetical protein